MSFRPFSSTFRFPSWFLLAGGALLLGLNGCSGGGGGSGGFATGGTLISVSFPDPSDQSSQPNSEGPTNASLVQQIILVFDKAPNPSEVGSTALPVRDPQGFSVSGTYQVAGSRVTFTPDLPTRPLEQITQTTFDTGGTSLNPATTYSVIVGPTTWSWVRGVTSELRSYFPDASDPGGIRAFFSTTDDPALFYGGLPKVSPKMVSVSPADGSSNVSPHLYTDPDGLFPPSEPFLLEFDAPLNPSRANVGDLTFRIIDLEDRPPRFPSGLPLGAYVEILSNRVDGATVQVNPSGVLPFGHLLSLEYPTSLKGMSEGAVAGSESIIAASFDTSELPAGFPGPVRDEMRENFDTQDRLGDITEIEQGSIPASWDSLVIRDRPAGVLQATSAFKGAGELGRFIPTPPPPGETRTIILDTSSQGFPLFDGSTPDAPAGLIIAGGEFPFSEIDIPDGIIIKPQGPNPLVLLATETVRIAGQINADATDGVDESSYDSAITSTPGGIGGPGGGRGGVGHPIINWPPDQINVLSLVSPPAGGRGWGPSNLAQIGGFGGETGIFDDRPYNKNFELHNACGELFDEHGNGTRLPGGGGGSFYGQFEDEQTPGYDGHGNIRADGMGGYILTPGGYDEFNLTLFGGQAGDPVFGDLDSNNNFIGVSGELKEYVGGQGGGGGASRLEAWFCGNECLTNNEDRDDQRCLGGEFPLGAPEAQLFAASVGDGKGGGGGGGGGGIVIRALGAVEVEASAVLTAKGGNGGGGETLGCSNWAGSGGGGAGGIVVIESAESILIKNGSTLDVNGGKGRNRTANDLYYYTCGQPDKCGGDGEYGLIQLQVPFGETAVIEKRNSLKPRVAWVDPQNTDNPAAFTPVSVGISAWYDLGRMVDRALSPTFRFHIAGREVGFGDSGFVETNDGFVVDPKNTDIVCDYFGMRNPLNDKLYIDNPEADFIPENATVRIEFQGGDAIVEGSKEVDTGTLTAWSASPAMANGKQFIRYRITFDIAAPIDVSLAPALPLPSITEFTLHAEY